jgi:hypothetical protein
VLAPLLEGGDGQSALSSTSYQGGADETMYGGRVNVNIAA